MTRSLKDILAVAGAIVLILPELGCGSTPAKSTSNAGGTSSGGRTSNGGATTNTGGAINGGSTSNTGGTSDAGGVCDASIPINAGDTCDIEPQSDAGPPPDAGAASDLAKPGPYAVGHVSYMLSDTTVYARPVAVSVWYPVDTGTITSATPPAQYPLDTYSNKLPVSTSTDWEVAGFDRAYEGPTPSGNGPFPLLMLSPCLTGEPWQYLHIGTRLASHGYVVAVTGHYEDGQWPWSGSSDMEMTVFNRPQDVSFAITELLQKNAAAGESLRGIIDPSKIAVSGHSLGGYSTFAVAGGDENVCASLYPANYGNTSLPYAQSTCIPIAPDPRIAAMVSLDGSSQFLRYEELARISVPSLIMGETIEHTVSYNPMPPDPNQGLWIARPHAAIHRSNSYRVDVTIANHMSFAVVCEAFDVMSRLGVNLTSLGINPNGWPCAVQGTFDPANNPATRQIVTTYMLAFLNTYFGREDDSWMLTSSYARQYQPQVEFFDSEACNECQVSQGDYAYRPHPCQCSVAQQDPADYFAPTGTDGGAP